jgi:hypothetical protein
LKITKGRMNAPLVLQHAKTVTFSTLAALANLITSLTPFVVTIFGGALLRGNPVSSILKIRCGLS